MNLKNIFKPYTGLPRSVYVLFFASIVNNMGNFVNPFLAMFLTEKLGFNTGAAGFFVMIGSISGLLGSLIGGKLIDHVGRKKVAVIFQGLSAVFIASCAFLGSTMSIPYLLIISSLFLGIAQPVFGTIVTDVTTPDNRKAAFSLTYLALNIGFSVGPLIAGFLYRNYIKILFLGDAATTIFSVALVALYVKETMPSKDKINAGRFINSDERAEEGSLFSALLKRPNLIAFSAITVLYFFIFSQFTFGLALQANETFRHNGSKVFGSLMTVNALGVTVLTVFITGVTRKLKSIMNMSIGGLFYAIGFGMLFFVDSYIMFIISTFIWTLGEILISTNTSVYIADHTPISHRGRFNSIFPIIRKIGFALGPYLAGIYVNGRSVRIVWPVTFTLSLAGAALMYMLYIYERKKGNLEAA